MVVVGEYVNNNTQISPKRWIFIEMRSGEVNIHRWSPTLKGIIVLVFAQSVNGFGEFQF